MLFALYALSAFAFGSLVGEFGEAHEPIAATFCAFFSLICFAFAIVSILDSLPEGAEDTDDL